MHMFTPPPPTIRNLIKKTFNQLGYEIRQKNKKNSYSQVLKIDWDENCNDLMNLKATNYELNRAVFEEYEINTVTSLNIEELLTLSARTVDPTDTVLGKISQLEHTLQLAALVQNYGINWILSALLHDLGKCAGNYHPKYAANIMGSAYMIEGVGFDESKPTLRYSHSEWAYRRFKDKIPKESSDLIRFHNVCHNGLQYISRSNPELAKKIIIFKEAEQYAKELYGQSMEYSKALTLLKSFFQNEKFSI